MKQQTKEYLEETLEQLRESCEEIEESLAKRPAPTVLVEYSEKKETIRIIKEIQRLESE